ncbi:MAG: GDSL family lipase, partial [Firmicutes bacterium]|nr:GDSL family lipase [Candidatus Colimorpha enterica]
KSGMLKKYIGRAKEVCRGDEVPVCDLYPVWEKLEAAGADTTELLANKLNHPIREYHYYMAMKLAEMIFSIN